MAGPGPLDSQIQQRGYSLFNVNNLKLARYKEIFPAAAKNEQIDARKMLKLFHLRESLRPAKEVLREVKERPDENQRLKRLTRRRRQLVQEKVRVVSWSDVTGCLTPGMFIFIFPLTSLSAFDR